jgi:hypothetical protein
VTRDPDARLARLVLRGFAEIDRDPARADRARAWLLAHPSAEPAVDALWLDALVGRGPLIAWRTSQTWSHPTLPLHTVLASHSFPDLDVWSIRETFRAS